MQIAHDNAARPNRRGLLGALGATAVATAVTTAASPFARAAAPTTFLDLTHTLTPSIPMWPGNPPPATVPVAWHASGGFAHNAIAMWEHTGTHIDAPVHRIPDGASTEEIAVRDLVAPLVIIDISARSGDADTTLTRADIDEWRTRYGDLPERAFVAMYSGWERRLTDPDSFVNVDDNGVPHAPGFDPDAARYLVAECGVVGVGVDTLSLDAATSPDSGAHTAILGAGRYGVEMLANLGSAPPSGATVVVGAPKHAGGTGGPCRVLALA